MTTNTDPAVLARMNAARENDGKFGNQLHAEHPDGPNVLSGTPDRPEWLNGWPETLPVPELSFHFDDGNNITTTASVNGQTFIEAWNPADDIHDEEYATMEMDFPVTDDEAAAAATWLQAKHDDIATEMRAEMRAAAERIQRRVLAKTTGTVAPVSDEELDAIITGNAAVINQAQKDVELAATARIARGALENHPTAASIVLDTAEVDDEGEVVTGFTVRDAEGTLLADYDSSEAGWAGYAANLPASNGWWETYTPKEYQTEDDGYTIDLAAAAAWAPGQN